MGCLLRGPGHRLGAPGSDEAVPENKSFPGHVPDREENLSRQEPKETLEAVPGRLPVLPQDLDSSLGTQRFEILHAELLQKAV